MRHGIEYCAKPWRTSLLTLIARVVGFVILLTPGVLVLTTSLLVLECSRSRPSGAIAPKSAVESVKRAQEKISLRGVELRPDGELLPNSKPVLDEAAALLKTQPDAEVYFDAYCDPPGGAKLNQRLSKERADAVKAYLEKHGIAPERLIARGFGATDFVASNASTNGRRQNRRIELVLLRNQSPVPSVAFHSPNAVSARADSKGFDLLLVRSSIRSEEQEKCSTCCF